MLDAKVFLKLLQLDLQAHPPGAPIVKIHLSAEPARPRALQSGLFQPLFPEPEKLELTLARIAGHCRRRKSGVGGITGHASRRRVYSAAAPVRPQQRRKARKSKGGYVHAENDSACRVETLEANAKEKTAQEKMSAVIALRLFRPPLGASVTLREAKPVRMRCLEREDIAGEIVWTAGPWRSSGDWSEQEGWSREEWDIAISAETGLVLYRLVQDKLSGNWFVEGMYD
jgi:protein ImuB